MATGGSTNAVLHYLAIASAAGVEVDDRRLRARAQARAGALRPQAVGQLRRGRLPPRRRRAAGAEVLLDARRPARRLHDDHRTHDRPRSSQRVPAQPRADQDVIRPWDKPMYAQGHLAILRGNLAPEGCVAKITGLKNPSITGPARVFDSEPPCMEAIMAKQIQRRRRDRDPLRRPEGRAGHAGDAGADLRADRPGPRRVGGPHHRRPLLGRHLGHGRRARRARGVRRRHRSRSSRKATRSRSTRTSC